MLFRSNGAYATSLASDSPYTAGNAASYDTVPQLWKLAANTVSSIKITPNSQNLVMGNTYAGNVATGMTSFTEEFLSSP